MNKRILQSCFGFLSLMLVLNGPLADQTASATDKKGKKHHYGYGYGSSYHPQPYGNLHQNGYGNYSLYGYPTPNGYEYGGWQPGGYSGRVGSPYYYSGQDHPEGVYPTQGYGYGYGYGINAPRPALPNLPRPQAQPLGNDLYSQHFGPGFYRHSEYGHHRFPYYSYRRPWYFPGPASYNRDTNLAW